jgi:hypothetical protein
MQLDIAKFGQLRDLPIGKSGQFFQPDQQFSTPLLPGQNSKVELLEMFSRQLLADG